MVTGINHITLAVKNIDVSFEFYSTVLGIKPLVKWDKGAYFLVGDFWFCLNLDNNRIQNPCCTHYAFSIDKENFEITAKRIIDSGAIVFKDNTSPGDSLYFFDPDYHKIEIHVGDWKTRINAKKNNHGDWINIKWFV